MDDFDLWGRYVVWFLVAAAASVLVSGFGYLIFFG